MYKLVGCDTDSIKFCRQDDQPMSQDEMDNILKKMNDAVPEGIILEEDGYYQNFLVIKSKNYVTFDGKETIFKGSSIKDAKKEPILREFMNECINLIMFNKSEQIEKLYKKVCLDALNPADIKKWLVKKTITEKVLDPKRSNEEKVLDACNHAVKMRAIQGVQAGDKVYVYQAINGLIQDKAKGKLIFNKKDEPKMIDNKILKFGELYNNDHDKWHYVQRVYDTLCILENVITIKVQDGFKTIKGEQVPKYKPVILNYSLGKNRELLK